MPTCTGTAKSVVLTAQGKAKAEALLQALFSVQG